MPAAFSHRDALKAHTPHCHGENMSKPLRDAKRLVTGCAPPWKSKPLDDERVFSSVFLGHAVRCLNTSASAVSTRPAVSCARHPRALSTSSGEKVKEKIEGASTVREGEVDVSEADDGVSGATTQEPKNTPVEMPKITDVSMTTAVHCAPNTGDVRSTCMPNRTTNVLCSSSQVRVQNMYFLVRLVGFNLLSNLMIVSGIS